MQTWPPSAVAPVPAAAATVPVVAPPAVAVATHPDLQTALGILAALLEPGGSALAALSAAIAIQREQAPWRERAAALDPQQVKWTLEVGTERARAVARKTLREVRAVMGLVA